MSDPADSPRDSSKEEGWRRACIALARIAAKPAAPSLAERAIRALRFAEEAATSNEGTAPLPLPALGLLATNRPHRFKLAFIVAVFAAAFILAIVGAWYSRTRYLSDMLMCQHAGAGDTIQRSGESRALARGTQLQEGDDLHSEAGGTSLSYSREDTRFLLQAGTDLQILDGKHGKQFFLRAGSIQAEVAKQAPGKPMLIQTPSSEMTVIGTRFSVAVTTESTRLDVASGDVELRRLSDSATVRVSSGHWVVDAPGPPLVSHPVLPSAGLALWLSADAGVVRNGEGVAMWEDQSGNERHAGQSLAESQPALWEKALNGFPAVKFDGADDYLETRLPMNGFSGATLFLVSANTENKVYINNGESAAIYWEQSALWGKLYLAPFQERIAFRFGTTEQGNQPVFKRVSSIESRFSLTSVLKDGDTESLFVDGALALKTRGKRPILTGIRDTCWIGRGSTSIPYFPGSIAEVVVYQRALPPAEREFVESYLRNKYFSPPEQPPGH